MKLRGICVDQPKAPATITVNEFLRAGLRANPLTGGGLRRKKPMFVLVAENKMTAIARHAAETHTRYTANGRISIHQEYVRCIHQVSVDWAEFQR